MNRRPLLCLITLGFSVVALVSPGEAKPRPPITNTYSVGPLVPFPNATWTAPCQDATAPPSRDIKPFKAPAAGSLVVVISGFEGDWDGALLNAAGKRVASSDNAAPTPPNGNTAPKETIKYKVKQAGDFQIVACNFLGSPLGSVTYTFTYK